MDGRELRNIFGQFATGVTVVCTTDAEGNYYGITVNSFSSLSLDPPLALFSLAHDSNTLKPIQDSGKFSINILSGKQQNISNLLAKKGGPEKMEAVPVSTGQTGAPLVNDALAYMDCELHTTYDGGDHIIIVGKIVAAKTTSDDEPLLFFSGGYRSLAAAD